ncbi:MULTISPECIES: hypothetical protein [unclassified Pseudoxanthomonas]|uniref:hypothetical protein n=1 Tax=unclassified Pseudoxanthomonas TaxID=2645906 RepID=UPI0011145838|nr:MULTISPECIES: hypothetical protein [unclassified Pseudoxanthomonas]
MSSGELATALARSTQVVRRFISGELSAQEFISEYDNFFYFEAFDGHEASSAREYEDRARRWIAIELHRRIQEEVVNSIVLSGYSQEVMRESGRIGELEARERARAICAEKGLDAILEDLGRD